MKKVLQVGSTLPFIGGVIIGVFVSDTPYELVGVFIVLSMATVTALLLLLIEQSWR